LAQASDTTIMGSMNTHVDHLIDEALALAPDERSAVVVALLDSLDGDDEIAVTKAWAVEIQQRRNDLRSGATKAVPWSEARNRLADL
jgi:putative addiction module component (TIGR02574 family)